MIWSASRVFPVPGWPATRLMDRVGSPPPRMRSRSGLPVARSSRLGWFFVTDPSGWRDDSKVLEARDLLDAANDHVPRQFQQQRSKLADQLAQRDRRVLDLPDESARQCVSVSAVRPQEFEIAELRTAEHCPSRGAPHQGGRGGGAENVCNAIPDQLEQRSATPIGARILDARSSAVPNARWCHLSACRTLNQTSDPTNFWRDYIPQRDGSRRHERFLIANDFPSWSGVHPLAIDKLTARWPPTL